MTEKPISAVTASYAKPIYLVHGPSTKNKTSPQEIPEHALPHLSAQWISPGESVRIADKILPGMIYVSSDATPALTDDKKHDPIIYSYLEVKNYSASTSYKPRISLDTFSWSYSGLSRKQRGAYLDWLLTPHTNSPEAYALLFLLGLEKRLLWEHRDAVENHKILYHVEYLSQLYKHHYVVSPYLQKFLDVARTLLLPPERIRPSFERVSLGRLPFSLRLALGHKLKHGEAISSPWLLSYYMAHPYSHTAHILDYTFDTFSHHFHQHFHQQFPQGLVLSGEEEKMPAIYDSVSGAFALDLSPLLSSYPDITFYTDLIPMTQDLVHRTLSTLSLKHPQPPRHPYQQWPSSHTHSHQDSTPDSHSPHHTPYTAEASAAAAPQSAPSAPLSSSHQPSSPPPPSPEPSPNETKQPPLSQPQPAISLGPDLAASSHPTPLSDPPATSETAPTFDSSASSRQPPTTQSPVFSAASELSDPSPSSTISHPTPTTTAPSFSAPVSTPATASEPSSPSQSSLSSLSLHHHPNLKPPHPLSASIKISTPITHNALTPLPRHAQTTWSRYRQIRSSNA